MRRIAIIFAAIAAAALIAFVSYGLINGAAGGHGEAVSETVSETASV